MATLNDLARLDEDQFYDISHVSLSEIPLSSDALCPGNTSFDCRKRLIQLQRDVVADYPIPIPQPNVPALISPGEAVESYRKYIANHAGEPKLIAFRQLYPRILLNNYGILASNNHALILYFTEQMLNAHSQDFATLAQALTLLKPDVPASQYNQWLTVTIREAEARKIEQQKLISDTKKQMAALSASTDFEQKKSYWLSLKFFLERLEATTVSADVVALHKLQQPARQ